jgi:Txe/YoeB family toxin of Txe-Axe toxin-antitoxin module
MKITWFAEAWQDYLYWQTHDKKTLNVSTTFCKILYAMVILASANRSR